MRCFIAIPVPDVIKKRLTDVQEDLRFPDPPHLPISWVRSEGMHLTLKFLGEIGEQEAARVTRELEGVVPEEKAFTVVVRGIGCFPSLRSPRVVWVGLEAVEERLLGLQQKVEDAMRALGFPSEDRKFAPHLTLGRVRSSDRADLLAQRMEKHHGEMLSSFEVREVQLMQSILKPEGAEYRSLQAFALQMSS